MLNQAKYKVCPQQPVCVRQFTQAEKSIQIGFTYILNQKVSYLESSFDFEFSSYVIWHTFLDLPLHLSSTCSVSLHFCKNNLHTF